MSKEVLLQEIKNAISKLAKNESSQEKCAGELHYRTDLTNLQKTWDALARMLTGSDTCVALTHYPGKNEIYITSNQPETVTAKKVLPTFISFIKNPFAEELGNLRCLVKGAVVPKLLVDEERKDQIKSTELGKAVDKTDLDTIFLIAKKALASGSHSERSRDENLAIEAVAPLIDLDIFINEFLNISRDNTIAKGIALPLIKSAITFLQNPDKLHAEMHLFDQMLSTVEKNSHLYFGITKLMCNMCDVVMHLCNGEKNHVNLSVQCSGSHGSTYREWSVPQFVVNNEIILRELLQLVSALSPLHDKHKELYPYDKISIPKESPEITKYKNFESIAQELDKKSDQRTLLSENVNDLRSQHDEIMTELNDTKSRIQAIESSLRDLAEREELQNRHNQERELSAGLDQKRKLYSLLLEIDVNNFNSKKEEIKHKYADVIKQCNEEKILDNATLKQLMDKQAIVGKTKTSLTSKIKAVNAQIELDEGALKKLQEQNSNHTSANIADHTKPSKDELEELRAKEKELTANAKNTGNQLDGDTYSLEQTNYELGKLLKIKGDFEVLSSLLGELNNNNNEICGDASHLG